MKYASDLCNKICLCKTCSLMNKVGTATWMILPSSLISVFIKAVRVLLDDIARHNALKVAAMASSVMFLFSCFLLACSLRMASLILSASRAQARRIYQLAGRLGSNIRQLDVPPGLAVGGATADDSVKRVKKADFGCRQPAYIIFFNGIRFDLQKNLLHRLVWRNRFCSAISRCEVVCWQPCPGVRSHVLRICNTVSTKPSSAKEAWLKNALPYSLTAFH